MLLLEAIEGYMKETHRKNTHFVPQLERLVSQANSEVIER